MRYLLSTIASALIILSSCPAWADIEIDLSFTAKATLKQGIVNGPDDYMGRTPQTDAVEKLFSAIKPTSWRFSGMRGYGYGSDMYQYIIEDYHYDRRFGTSTTINLQDVFNAKHGKPIYIKSFCRPRQSNCFMSFESLRRIWIEDLRAFLVSTEGTKIDYYDLLAEADIRAFIGAEPEQVYQLLTEAYKLVRELRPNAKIVVPSNATFNPLLMEKLMALASQDGLRLDALSWHEFGADPNIIQSHVAIIRGLYIKYPSLCQPTCPEIHINEYHSEETIFIPGYAVGWLYNLEKAGVAQANRSCWGGDPGSPVTYESCWRGFSGLLMPDSGSPQPLYWVYKFYADLAQARYAVSGLPENTGVISGPIGKNKSGILIGNYGDTKAVTFSLKNFPAASAQIDIYKITNTNNQIVSLPEVPHIQKLNSGAVNASVGFSLNDLAGGDAYWIVVTPLN